jgi:hypothetical protein
MKTIKLRVVIDTEEDIFRDLEVQEENLLIDFHEEIIKAFDFDGGQMASFFLSDEDWEKGEEYPLVDMSGDDSEAPSMDNTTVGSLLKQKGERLLYVYDFLRMWCFYIEVIDFGKVEKGKKYPQIILSVGKAPDEDSKELDFSHPASNFKFDDEFGDDFSDEFDDGFSSEIDDEFGGFEDIDDYDEFR